MPSNVAPPKKKPGVEDQIERPKDEVVWMKCRARKTCEGNQAQVLLKKNNGIHGTWIQYKCLTCNTPFGITL